MSGVSSLMRSKSSIPSSTPASRAIASRCSTTFVEPPVAAAQAMPFSRAGRVSRSRGRTPRRSRSITSSPARRPTSSLRGSVAPTVALPSGEMPRNSSTVAIVLAVYWAPQAPAPGQATSSSAVSSRSENVPAAWRPTASKTSWIVTSDPS